MCWEENDFVSCDLEVTFIEEYLEIELEYSQLSE